MNSILIWVAWTHKEQIWMWKLCPYKSQTDAPSSATHTEYAICCYTLPL